MFFLAMTSLYLTSTTHIFNSIYFSQLLFKNIMMRLSNKIQNQKLNR